MLSPVSIYRKATVYLDENGSPKVKSGEHMEWPKNHQDVDLVDLIFRDPVMIYHYFHFCELSIAAFAMIANFMPQARIQRIYVGTQAWNNAEQNFVQRNIIMAVFNPEKIVEGEPIGEDIFSSIIIDVDRYGPSHGDLNKYLESLIPFAKRTFPSLRSKVLKFADIDSTEISAGPSRRALYVKRGPPRTFAAGLEEQFLQMFADRGIELETIDFAEMNWVEQVRSTSRADLLVGIHGNGFTNCLWMPPGANVIEIFPIDTHHYDFQIFSEIARLNYFGVEGRAQYPFVYTSGSRFGGAYGYVGEPVTELSWRWLGQIIDGLNV